MAKSEMKYPVKLNAAFTLIADRDICWKPAPTSKSAWRLKLDPETHSMVCEETGPYTLRCRGPRPQFSKNPVVFLAEATTRSSERIREREQNQKLADQGLV